MRSWYRIALVLPVALLYGSAARGPTDPWGLPDEDSAFLGPMPAAPAVASELAATYERIRRAPTDDAAYARGLLLLRRLAWIEMNDAAFSAENEGGDAEAKAAEADAQRHQEAMALARRWVEAHPGEDALMTLAGLLGDDPEGRIVLERLRLVAPESPHATERVAESLRQDGRLDEAEELLLAFLGRHPDSAPAYRALADHYVETGSPNRERATIASWRRRMPRDNEAILEELRRFATELSSRRAVALTTRVVASGVRTERSEQLGDACEALREADHFEAAESCYRALAQSPDQRSARGARRGLLRVFLESERFREADAILDGMEPVDRSNIASELGGSALDLAKRHRCAGARHALAREARARGDSDWESRDSWHVLRHIDVFGRCGMEREAAEELATYLSHADSNNLAMFAAEAGKLRDRTAALEAGAAALQKRIALEPEEARAYEVLAELLRVAGDEPRYVGSLLTWSVVAEHDPKPFDDLAAALLARGQPISAASALEEAVRRAAAAPDLPYRPVAPPQPAVRYAKLVRLLLAGGAIERAERVAQEASLVDPMLNRLFEARIANHRGDWRAASEALIDYLEAVPPERWDRGAEDEFLTVLRAGEQWSAIAQWLERRADAVGADPGAGRHPEVARSSFLGMRWTDLQEPARALPHLLAADRESPDNECVLQYLASAYTQLGKTSEAETAYRRLLALAPHDSWHATPLASFLRERGRVEEALQLLRGKAEEADASPNAKVELARELLLVNHPAGAVAVLAPLEQSEDPLTLYVRGEALAAVGRKAESDRSFDHFLVASAPLASSSELCQCSCEVLELRRSVLGRKAASPVAAASRNAAAPQP